MRNFLYRQVASAAIGTINAGIRAAHRTAVDTGVKLSSDEPIYAIAM
jgi:hypothetical protein